MSHRDKIAVDADRLDTIAGAVERLAGGELDVEIPRDGSRDDIDAIAAGINMLVAELRYTTVSRQYLDSIVNAMVDVLLVVDAAGVILKINDSARAMLGYPDSEILDQPLSRIMITPEAGPLESELAAVAARSRPWRVEAMLRARDGQAIPVALTASPLDGEPGQIVCVARDLRETRRMLEERQSLEEQLQRAQKMEALGRLAGGVAHDFNNLLTAIVNFAEFLEDAIDPDDPHSKDVAGILDAAEKAERLIRRLLTFSRHQPREYQIVVVDTLIINMKSLLERILGEDVGLATRLAAGPGKVEIDPGQLEQVIMNLVVNARHAMVDGGTLVIETRHDEAASAISIAVIDTGIGMTEEVMMHIFEPFFTTKEQGKGTGLGLATCYGIIKQAGGAIDVESTPGVGTTFRILLPTTTITPAAVPDVKSHTAKLQGRETILLVEDEPVLCGLAKRILVRHGYTVITAENGVSALEELQRVSPEAVDLLLTDVVMPRMGGLELASRVKVIRADIKILFMSGYTGESALAEEVLSSRLLIPKPFTPAMLAERVRSILDEPTM